MPNPAPSPEYMEMLRERQKERRKAYYAALSEGRIPEDTLRAYPEFPNR